MSTAPKGFRFATACAGFRKEGRADLALLVSDVPAVAAGTFTQNRFPAAPVLVAKAMLAEFKRLYRYDAQFRMEWDALTKEETS